LGYALNGGTYCHPARKVIFLGDYIDRGPKIKETLAIVKAMVDNDHAIALMGNHEYNALCFHYPETEGGHLRKHLIKNILQHYETLKQFQNSQSEYEDYIEWFKTLPLFYETDHFRAVHACWDVDKIEYLRTVLPNACLTGDLVYQSAKKDTALNIAVEEVLKGKEIDLPPGLEFTDKDGTIRYEIRIKWWDDPLNATYRSISVEPLDLPETPVMVGPQVTSGYYHDNYKPVFFGHYWLKGNPLLYRENICCLDYSVAKDGYLVAYRFDREQRLRREKLVWL
jgi:hypothetical protein